MKVIDLLNKIANGEEVPKKIKWNSTIFDYYDNDYCAEGYSGLFEICVPAYINDEVQIIEEDKKIEKLYGIVNPREGTQRLPNNEELMYKINELIDEVNKLKDESR